MNENIETRNDSRAYTEHATPPAISESAKWSNREPIPAIGAWVYVTMNGWKWGTVTGYFTESGWIGVLVKPDVRPEWAVKQRKGLTPIHIFGAELATKEKLEKLAAAIPKH